MTRHLARESLAGLGCVAWLLVSGCAPTLATFVEPQAPGGEITNSNCPPQPDVLLFRAEGVVAAVHTRNESGRRQIVLSFEVPQGRRVRLAGSTVGVHTASGDRVRGELSGVWMGSRDRSAPAHPESSMFGRTERLRYGTRTGYGLTRHDFFMFTAEFATPLGDEFTVTLPRVTINGFAWDLPEVRFRRVRRWLITPFNC